MSLPQEQINYQTVLSRCQSKLPEDVLGVLVFNDGKPEASLGTLLPASLEGFPPALSPQKIHARTVNDQPCLIYSDVLPDKKPVCLIFPAHIPLASLRSQAAKTISELTALSAPKTGGLSSHEEAVLEEFIQAAANSRQAESTKTNTQPLLINLTPPAAQSVTEALFWPYWYQVF